MIRSIYNDTIIIAMTKEEAKQTLDEMQDVLSYSECGCHIYLELEDMLEVE